MLKMIALSPSESDSGREGREGRKKLVFLVKRYLGILGFESEFSSLHGYAMSMLDNGLIEIVDDNGRGYVFGSLNENGTDYVSILEDRARILSDGGLSTTNVIKSSGRVATVKFFIREAHA